MKKLLTFLACMGVSASAATLKIAALAPEGTNWANTMKEFSKEVKKATNGKVKVKIYYGGVAGDEPDVLRKIRVGQMHGGVFTGRVLGDIAGDIRAIELPFNFLHSEEKAMKALKGMTPYFNEKIDAKGFVNLGFYGIGQVYVVSTKKVTSIPEMQGVKIWSWEGDRVVEAMISSLQLVSVPLALPDVLSSLSTNIIDAAYAPPLGILALQWQSQIKYLINFPTAYSIGALLVSKKAWAKVPKEYRSKVLEIGKKYVDEANAHSVKDNAKGLETLKMLGVEFIEFNNKDIAKAQEIRGKVIEKIKGKVVSEKAIQMLESYR